MNKKVNISNKEFLVNKEEFSKINAEGYENLNILENVEQYERIISLINEFSLLLTSSNKTCIFYNQSHGGFMPINCEKFFNDIYIINDLNHECHLNAIKYNIKNFLINTECSFNTLIKSTTNIENSILFSYNLIDLTDIKSKDPPIIISLRVNDLIKDTNYKEYELRYTNLYVYIHKKILDSFLKEYHYRKFL